MLGKTRLFAESTISTSRHVVAFYGRCDVKRERKNWGWKSSPDYSRVSLKLRRIAALCLGSAKTG
jgi:hypothetical protein